MRELQDNFAQLKKLFASRESGGLKAFAAEAARQALEFDDKKLAQFSIVAYSLAKLMEKPYILHSSRWKKFNGFLLQRLSQGERCAGNKQLCQDVLGLIVREINSLSSDLGRFVVSVVEKAKIKAATQAYAHGASVGRAIELTGADRKELLSYIGVTRLPEKYETKKVSQRVAYADKLFK